MRQWYTLKILTQKLVQLPGACHKYWLAKAEEGNDAEVRRTALDNLYRLHSDGKIGKPAYIAILVKCLRKDEDGQLRRAAASNVTAMAGGNTGLLELLTSLVDDADPQIRKDVRRKLASELPESLSEEADGKKLREWYKNNKHKLE